MEGSRESTLREVEALVRGAGAKAAAEAMRVARRNDFIILWEEGGKKGEKVRGERGEWTRWAIVLWFRGFYVNLKVMRMTVVTI